MEITEFGENLHVLIMANIGEDWEAFATWYSVYKNLPHAQCSFVFIRNKYNTPFQLFQWTKRLSIPSFTINDRSNEFVNVLVSLIHLKKTNVLILPSLSMVLKPLNSAILYSFNKQEFLRDKQIYFVPQNQNLIQNLDDYIIKNQIPYRDTHLSYEAQDKEEIYSLITVKKGCGSWIDTRKGCPFASVDGLVKSTMTANEYKIFELWRRLAPLYSSVV